MKYFKILMVSVLMLISMMAVTTQAQEEPSAAATIDSTNQQQLQFYVDYATFRSSGDKVILEVYLMIPRQQMTYTKPDTLDEYLTRGFIQVGLAQNDSIRLLDRWPFTDTADSLGEIKATQSIPDMSIFEANPGDYELIAQVIDLNSDKRGVYRKPITLHLFDQKHITLSEIELASIVQPTSKKSIFTKYKQDIVPNASLTFGLGTPVMYSYAEIYNMQYPSDKDSFEVDYKVLDLNGNPVKELPTVVHHKVGKSSIDLGGLNVVGLSSGVYFYRIKVTDLATGEVAARTKKFYVYKPGEKFNTTPTFAGVNYNTMTEEQVDEEFNKLTPIITDKDRKTFNNASLEGKRNFLKQFWKAHDTNPSTAVNEFQQQYMQRLEYVKEHFGSSQVPGYKSDRGRVYLVYGPPDEIERNPVNLGGKPNQTWYYNGIQGGVIFVFVDKTGFGSYELVHSTARNEIYDPNWQRYIDATSTGVQDQGFH